MADGESVADRVARQGTLTETEAVIIAAEVAKVLQTTYGRGLIHGDVRLQNMQLMPNNTVALMGSTDTKTSMQADIRTDVFALGAALYHMVTGISPIETKPQWPRQVNEDLSESVCKVIAKMMATNLEERYQTPTELVLDMGILVQGDKPVIAANLPSVSAIPLPAGTTQKTAPMATTTTKTTKVKPRVGARQTSTGRTGSQRRILARSRRRKGLAAVLGGVFVLVAGLVVLSAGSADEEETPSPGPGGVVLVPPPSVTTDDEAVRNAKTALRIAREYAAEHPDDIPSATELFKEARRLGEGTPVAEAAREQLERLRALEHEKSKKRLGAARTKAMARAGRGDVDGALADIAGLPDWLRERHPDEVKAATSELERTGKASIDAVLAGVKRSVDARKPDEAERALAGLTNIRYEKGMSEAAKRIALLRDAIGAARRAAKSAVVTGAIAEAAKLIQQFDRMLAKGDYAGARRHVTNAAARGSLRPVAKRLGAAAGVAKALLERDAAVMRGARSLVGKNVAIATPKGKHKGTLEDVNDDDLRVAVKIVDRGRVLGQSKMTVKWGDLTAEQVDEFIELGTWRASNDEKSIASAYRALHAGDWAETERLAEKAPGHPLSAHLTARVAAKRTRVAEEGARKAWDEIAAGTRADPIPPKDAKRLAALLDEFVKSHGATAFAKARKGDVDGLRVRLELAQMAAGLGRGLVGFWRFDDGAGARAVDSSGKGGHGKVTGAQWVAGRVGKALSFDGSGAHVAIGDLPQLRVTGDLTIAFWMKPASLNGRRNPLGKCYGGEGMMTLEPSGAITFFYGTSGVNAHPYVAAGSPRCAVGEWAHMVLVRDMTTKKVMWYKNAKPGGARDVPYDTIAESKLTFDIGKGYVGTFHGLLDDIRVYERALTAKEVDLLYRSAPPAAP